MDSREDGAMLALSMILQALVDEITRTMSLNDRQSFVHAVEIGARRRIEMLEKGLTREALAGAEEQLRWLVMLPSR